MEYYAAMKNIFSEICYRTPQWLKVKLPNVGDMGSIPT